MKCLSGSLLDWRLEASLGIREVALVVGCCPDSLVEPEGDALVDLVKVEFRFLVHLNMLLDHVLHLVGAQPTIKLVHFVCWHLAGRVELGIDVAPLIRVNDIA